MKYERIVPAKFIERENRFVARVALPDGEVTKVHVKNTGRCRELLLHGHAVYLEDFEGRMGSRRMRYSLVAVEKKVGRETILINMDSQAPNKVVQEALADGRITLPGMTELTLIQAEKQYDSSRFDFYVESGQRKAFIEVKGVTLEEDGHARFPDAPTERGVKHIRELIKAKQEGYGAYIIFVVQMEGMKDVAPNDETHPAFGEALAEASQAGVHILAYDCRVTPDSLTINEAIDFLQTPVKAYKLNEER
ncbi:MAG: DNA/RNA nuclease SfsA [Clostridia bacterium]|nr:DNA/RNA nuclease SfsA [Clostridia bacterium]